MRILSEQRESKGPFPLTSLSSALTKKGERAGVPAPCYFVTSLLHYFVISFFTSKPCEPSDLGIASTFRLE